MKRNILLILVLLVLQVVLLCGGTWLSVSVRSNCFAVPGEFGNWICTPDENPAILPLIAFVILPPLLVLLVSRKFGPKLSWKRVVITHIIVGLIVVGILTALSAPHCGCGGV